MKVLVPYDGAELSEHAAVMAIELLAQHSLDVVLLRVAPNESYEAEAKASLEAAAARIAASPAAVQPVLAFGSPAEEIVRSTDQNGADLIAMSTHARPIVARMILGSVTDRVIRTSPVPVLVLHPPTMSLDRLSPPAGRKLRILAPIDGSRFAEDAVEMAISLLRPELVEVTLLTVITLTPLRDTAFEAQESFASRLRERGVTVSCEILRGDPVDQIAALAERDSYDLIVMATHAHGNVARLLIGDTTDGVIRTASAPVLVIEPRSMEIPVDPVSGEEVDPETAAYTSEYHGRVFAFTSFEHKQQFDGAPEAYLGPRLNRPRGFPSPYDGFAEETRILAPLTREV